MMKFKGESLKYSFVFVSIGLFCSQQEDDLEYVNASTITAHAGADGVTQEMLQQTETEGICLNDNVAYSACSPNSHGFI